VSERLTDADLAWLAEEADGCADIDTLECSGLMAKKFVAEVLRLRGVVTQLEYDLFVERNRGKHQG
jgi:hypothetical protein